MDKTNLMRFAFCDRGEKTEHLYFGPSESFIIFTSDNIKEIKEYSDNFRLDFFIFDCATFNEESSEFTIFCKPRAIGLKSYSHTFKILSVLKQI
jgi:hypothetical protein